MQRSPPSRREGAAVPGPPRFRGHPDRRECSPGKIHGQAPEDRPQATPPHLRARVQDRGGPLRQGRRPRCPEGRRGPRPERDRPWGAGPPLPWATPARTGRAPTRKPGLSRGSSGACRASVGSGKVTPDGPGARHATRLRLGKGRGAAGASGRGRPSRGGDRTSGRVRPGRPRSAAPPAWRPTHARRLAGCRDPPRSCSDGRPGATGR
jgi:hypothetical protein